MILIQLTRYKDINEDILRIQESLNDILSLTTKSCVGSNQVSCDGDQLAVEYL